MAWKAIRTRFTGGRSSAGTSSRPCTVGVGVVIGEEREQAGDRDSVLDLAVSSLYQPPMWIGGAVVRVAQPLERRELGGLALGDLSRDPVAHDDLRGRRERGERERHGEPARCT